MTLLAASMVSRDVIRSGQVPETPDQTYIDDVIDFGKKARNCLNAYSHIPVVSTLTAIPRALLGVIEIVSSVVLALFYLPGMLCAPIDNGKNFLKSVGMIFRGLNDITRAGFEAIPLVGNAILFVSDAFIGNAMSDALDQKVFTRTHPLYSNPYLEQMSLVGYVPSAEDLAEDDLEVVPLLVDQGVRQSASDLARHSAADSLLVVEDGHDDEMEADPLSPSSESSQHIEDPLLGGGSDSSESMTFSVAAFVPRKAWGLTTWVFEKTGVTGALNAVVERAAQSAFGGIGIA